MTHTFILTLKNKTETFSFGELFFQPILSEYIEMLRMWRNKEENRTKFIFDGIISSEEQISWYESYKVKNDDLMFIVSEKDSDTFFATVSLYNIDFESSSAEFGRLMIGEESFKGKGIGKFITSAMITYAFENLKLSKVYLDVFSDNLAAIKTYEKVGFVAVSHIKIKDRLVTKMIIER